MAGDTRLDFKLPRTPALIQLIRQFIEQTCLLLLRDAALSSRIAVATHELVENAVKYSTDGTPTLAFELVCNDGGSKIMISTENRADPRDLAVLEASFREIAESREAMTYYLGLLEKAALRDTGSGLGLARILAETDMSVTASFKADRVIISAHCTQAPRST